MLQRGETAKAKTEDVTRAVQHGSDCPARLLLLGVLFTQRGQALEVLRVLKQPLHLIHRRSPRIIGLPQRYVGYAYCRRRGTASDGQESIRAFDIARTHAKHLGGSERYRQAPNEPSRYADGGQVQSKQQALPTCLLGVFIGIWRVGLATTRKLHP